MENDEIDRVIFRADRSGPFKGDVTAVLIDQDDGNGGVGCYAHLGQHSGCTRAWYYTTRPATPAEYAELKAELESEPYGYKFKVLKRWPFK